MPSAKTSCRNHLVKSIAVVEATTYERLMLRSQWGKIYSWEDIKDVHALSMGTLDKRDIAVEFTYAIIDGYEVAFWQSTGPVLDREMVESWVQARMGDKGYVTKAIDFGNVISRIATSKKRSK